MNSLRPITCLTGNYLRHFGPLPQRERRLLGLRETTSSSHLERPVRPAFGKSQIQLVVCDLLGKKHEDLQQSCFTTRVKTDELGKIKHASLSSLAQNKENPVILISMVSSFLKTPVIQNEEKKPTRSDSSLGRWLQAEEKKNAPDNGITASYSTNKLQQNGRRQLPSRPKLEKYKETYERLKRLGIDNIGQANHTTTMTSPNTNPRLKCSGRYSIKSPVDRTKRQTIVRKPTEIKSKFLQNNLLLKIQQFYSSQGKEVPEVLRQLSRGRQTNSDQKVRFQRYQLYPCTSPSSGFSRNTKLHK